MKIWSVAAVLFWGMDASSAAQGVKRIRRFTIEVNDGSAEQSEQQQQFVELKEGFYKYDHGGKDKKKTASGKKVTDVPFYDMDDIMRYLRVDSFSLSLPHSRPSAPTRPSHSPPRNPSNPSGVPTAPSPATPSSPSSPTTPSSPSSPTAPSSPTIGSPAPFASPSGGSGTDPNPSPVDDLTPLTPETPVASPSMPVAGPSTVTTAAPNNLSVTSPTTAPVDAGVPTSQPSASPTDTSNGQPSSVTPSPNGGSSVTGDCNVADRSAALFNLTATISDEFSLGVMGTPPFLARLWMDQQDDLELCPDEENKEAFLQRYALAVLYFSLGGSGWDVCGASSATCAGAARWLDPVSECEWFGVTCENGSVVKIVLKENGLEGELPGELFSLLDLTQLSLDHNEITGDIPGDFIVLQKLEILELDSNQLSGGIPIQLYQMPTLQALDLNNNTLTGSLSSRVSNWANLMVLQLENNQLAGAVPTSSFLQLSNLSTYTKKLVLVVHCIC